jgi:signal transduction histidine kinase
MSQPSLAHTVLSQEQLLAGLSSFAAGRPDPRLLLEHAREILLQLYGPVHVQLGPPEIQPAVPPPDTHSIAPPGQVLLVLLGGKIGAIPHAAPFPAGDASSTGFGLLLGLDTGDLVGWWGDRPRALLPGDVQFLRSLAFLVETAFDRRAPTRDRRAQARRVSRAKQQWEAAVDAMSQGIVLLDRAARVLRINRTLETWGLAKVRHAFGGDLDTILGNLQPPCAGTINQALVTLACGEACELESELVPLARHLRLTLTRLPENTEPGTPYAVLVIEDITRQHDAEEVLAEYGQRLELLVQARTRDLERLNTNLMTKIEEQQRDRQRCAAAEKRYNTLVENTLAGIALVRNDVVEFCNGAFARAFRRSRERLMGCRVDELVDAPDQAAWHAAAGQACTLRLRREDDAPAAVRSHTSAIDTPEGPALLWNIIDVSHETCVEEELRRSRAELQQLSEILLQTQERERKRVALELHDGIGQSLSALRIGIQAHRSSDAPPMCRQCPTLIASSERIQSAIEEVRRIALDLRPPMLDDLGLLPTLDWFCREFERNHARPTLLSRFRVTEETIPRRLRVVIFRIVQEAVRNVVEHAGATTVAVTLMGDGQCVALGVSDDGCGFEQTAPASSARRGIGLGSMRERAEMSGGEFQLTSVQGVGTRIRVRWKFSR